MALATIPLSDADRLPPVCACCGAAATYERFETYTCNPRWVNVFFLLGVLPWLLLRFVTRRAATLRVPACDCHAEGDRRVDSILLAGVAAGLVLASAGYALVRASDDRGMSVLVCAACVVATAALGAIGVADHLIRARAIGDQAVVLTGVSERFAGAVAKGERAKRRLVPARRAGPPEETELTTAKYLRTR